MLGLHMPELIVVLVIALLIFGPKKLPEMGSAIGKSIKEFRKGVNEISNPKDAELSAPKESLPITTSNLDKVTTASFANEEVGAEKVAD